MFRKYVLNSLTYIQLFGKINYYDSKTYFSNEMNRDKLSQFEDESLKKDGTMEDSKGIILFEEKHVRRIWDEKEEKWYFSVVDVIGILTEQPDYRGATKYWNTTKTRLVDEGSQLSTDCRQLKMKAQDGKMRLTDCADAEQLLRIIQSIPSKKAEPFKLWLAKVGYERMQEIENPELAAKRMHDTYLAKGYSEEWVALRMRGIATRETLTDEWKNRGG
jgi:hypothetical protein